MNVFLIDPPGGPLWRPFCDSRPVCELRAGAWLIRERWEGLVNGTTQAIFAQPHLHDFTEGDAPPVDVIRAVDGPAVVGRADFAPTGIPLDAPNDPACLTNDGDTVGWFIPSGERWDPEDQPDGWPELEIEGMQLRGAYDVITALEHFLVRDVLDFTIEDDRSGIPEGSIVIGDPNEVVILNATVEPGVTFDVQHGAIVIEQHAYVRGGTRLEGPVYVGPGTQVLGGPVAWSALGPLCKVRGELSHCAFLGYANKSHDGFVGHSVIGRWVNLGAGTVTSNLKNTYGTVRLDADGVTIETDRQLLGSLLGDHAKTAIGTLLGTGTIVGVGANVFGSTRPPKYVGPFSWGSTGDLMRKEGFLLTASRSMPRRHVEVTDAVRVMLEAVYERATQA